MLCGGGEKKNTTNPKQNADGSCADSPLSALWWALLCFMWVSSLVLILLSLPSYLSVTHSLVSSISWLINRLLFQAMISPAAPHLSLRWLFWPLRREPDATQQLHQEGVEEKQYEKKKKKKRHNCMKSEWDKSDIWNVSVLFFFFPKTYVLKVLNRWASHKLIPCFIVFSRS